nr:hypothetical protein CFP56_24338 [Quercus suber]
MSNLQWYNSTMAMLEGQSPEDVSAAATKNGPSPHSSDDSHKYSLMFDDLDGPYDLSVLGLPEDTASIAGEPDQEYEKTLHKLTGDCNSTEIAHQVHGLGISAEGDDGDRASVTNEDECSPFFYDPQLKFLHAAGSVDYHNPRFSYGSRQIPPSSPLVPAPLKVRSPQVQQSRSVTSPLIEKRSGITYSTRMGEKPFSPVRDENFFRMIEEDRQKRVEALGTKLTHPLHRPSDFSPSNPSQTGRSQISPALHGPSAQSPVTLSTPKAVAQTGSSSPGSSPRRVTAPELSSASNSTLPMKVSWIPSLPPTRPLPPVPPPHQTNPHRATFNPAHEHSPNARQKDSVDHFSISSNSPANFASHTEDTTDEVTPTKQTKRISQKSTTAGTRSLAEFLAQSDGGESKANDDFMRTPESQDLSPRPRVIGKNVVHHTQVQSPWRGNIRPLSAVHEADDYYDDTASSRSLSPSPSDCSTIRQENYTSGTNTSPSPDSSNEDHNDTIASLAITRVGGTGAVSGSRASRCNGCKAPALTRCGGCSVLVCTSCSSMCEHAACLSILCGECGTIGLCEPHIPNYFRD